MEQNTRLARTKSKQVELQGNDKELTSGKKRMLTVEKKIDDGNESKKRRKLNNGAAMSLPSNVDLALVDFKIGEVVWAKIKGFPHWPCIIRNFDKKMVLVQWYNDYRSTKVYRTQLFKFLENFNEFSKSFNQKIGLDTFFHSCQTFSHFCDTISHHPLFMTARQVTISQITKCA